MYYYKVVDFENLSNKKFLKLDILLNLLWFIY